MKIGVLREKADNETRVALIPSMLSILKKANHDIFVESGAGAKAMFSDEMYKNEGAEIVSTPAELFEKSDLILKVQPLTDDEVAAFKKGQVYVGYMAPFTNVETLKKLGDINVTSFAMDFIPRITRAQSMDALSSQTTVAGYYAVLMAATQVPKFFPLLMTAAGTIPPAIVLILGAGVAGLQAIATAKRLGAKVEAFDPRVAVKEQVMSLGAQFVEMEMPEDMETEGGYAKEASDEFIKKEHEAIGARLPRVDVVITTAQVFGKQAPLLMTEDMVKQMRPGSVIIDLAAEQGGNCALTKPGKVIEKHGVKIDGTLNLPAKLPAHASQMYSKNATNLIKHLYSTESGELDFEDEITKGACITHGGEIVNEFLKSRLQ
ncbi:MAG: Re/Si-specific NAD(P)(+) transhydrogenase subunit alpha [bacterium]